MGVLKCSKRNIKSKPLNIFSESNQPGKAETYVNASSTSVDSRSFVGFGYNREGI